MNTFLIVFILVNFNSPIRFTLKKLQNPPKKIEKFKTVEEMFNFKPNILIRKMNPKFGPKPRELSLSLGSSSDQKFSKNAPSARMLKGPPPPPVINHDMLVMPTSIPQITAPRMILRNFSKPTEVNYLNGFGRKKAQITISPNKHQTTHMFGSHPFVVPRNLRIHKKRAVFFENQPQKLTFAKKNRRLTVRPFLDVGQGHVDIGSHGYSKLSYALFNPNTTTMGPFVPRRSPPPPIRIQIHEPEGEKSSRKMLVSYTEKELLANQARNLQLEVDNQFSLLKSDVSRASTDITEKYQLLVEKILNLKKSNIANDEHSKALEENVKKEIESRINEFKDMAFGIRAEKNRIEKNYDQMIKMKLQLEGKKEESIELN